MRRLTLLLLATWLLLQPAALAFEWRHGDEVVIPAGTTIPDDLYVAGGNVRVEGTVLGDLIVTGGDVTVTGDIRHDLTAVGGHVDLRGRVGRSIRAAGGMIRVSSKIGNDLLLAGGTIHQETESRVAGDGAFAGGTVTIGGTIGKQAKAAGGDVTLQGRMGPTTVFSSTLQVEDTARIKGPLIYTSEATAEIAAGAVISGGVTHHAQPVRHRGFPGPRWGWWVVLLVASLVSGGFALLLLPKAAERVLAELEWQPLIALLIGFSLVVGTPIALGFLCITVVGIPLAMTLLGLYLVGWHVAWLVAGLALGLALLRRATFRSQLPRQLSGLAIGVFLLLILQFIPFVGWLIGFLAVCVGFGGIAMAIAHAQGRGSLPPPEPPARLHEAATP